VDTCDGVELDDDNDFFGTLRQNLDCGPLKTPWVYWWKTIKGGTGSCMTTGASQRAPVLPCDCVIILQDGAPVGGARPGSVLKDPWAQLTEFQNVKRWALNTAMLRRKVV
jgi:hypothetical protein